MPTPTPTAVQVPARRPWATLSRTTMAKSGPGLATASRWISATVRNSAQYIAPPVDGNLATLRHSIAPKQVQLMSNCARAVFLDHASLDLGDLDLSPLRQVFGELVLHPATTGEQVAERLQGAQVAISNKVRLDATTLAACPELKLIMVAATGTNNVDLAAARERGIIVANCRGYGTASVAQHTLTLLLALATRLPDYQAAIRDGAWQRASQFCLLDFPIVELEGKTLG